MMLFVPAAPLLLQQEQALLLQESQRVILHLYGAEAHEPMATCAQVVMRGGLFLLRRVFRLSATEYSVHIERDYFLPIR